MAEQYGQRTDLLNDRRLVFAGNRFTLSAGHGEVRGIIPSAGLEGDFTLELASPRQIELKQNDFERSWHLRGIYELDGDNLRVCLNRPIAEEQLAEFATKPNSEQLLLILKRE